MLWTLPFFGTLPLQGTEIAGKWDTLYIFLVVLSLVFFVLVIGAMAVFAVKYHQSRKLKPEYIEGNHLIEVIWTIVPTILVMIIFVWGYSVYRKMIEAPSDAYEIHAIAKQWLWQFQYDTGRTEINKLYVPLNKPVKIISTSEDVLHSLFVPDFRVKKDVVPGMYTQIWFEATVPGVHHLFCAEYCGTSHSGMIGSVIVLDDKQWHDFIRGRDIHLASEGAAAAAPGGAIKLLSMADRGKELFQSKGCTACHSDNGVNGVGPSLKGVAGSQVELTDGSKVTADDNYIRESIEVPAAKIVKGFQPVMPMFKGLLKEDELNALMAYVKSLK